MRFICANRVSTFFRSRDCRKASGADPCCVNYVDHAQASEWGLLSACPDSLLDEGEHEPAGLPEYWQADRCGARPMDLTRKQVERAQAREQKLITPQTSYGAGWQYDYRRCAVGHVVGDLYFRICSEYPVEFDIMKDRDK
jgi:hypothetical protein